MTFGSSGVTTVEVAGDEADLRLDRWFKRHFPRLTQGRLQKLLRTGQVRIDGRRAKAGARLVPGQRIRVPPLGGGEQAPPKAPKPRPKIDAAQAEALRESVLHRDHQMLAVNKPPGLAVQGGTGIHRHLDAMLDELRFDAGERPRLVHRLDKDASGVLLLARSAAAASKMTAAFRSREARKLYWAVVAGTPKPSRGRIDLALAKLPGPHGERVSTASAGKRALTDYRVVEKAGREAAWLALEPQTGRTHQLRVHCAAIGTPILGDGKYGGGAAYLAGSGIARRLHLHARAIRIPHPDGGILEVTAPLPDHMLATWRFFGFDPQDADGGFENLSES